jgi:hypothetical protein
MNEAYSKIFTRDFRARATVEAGLVARDGLGVQWEIIIGLRLAAVRRVYESAWSRAGRRFMGVITGILFGCEIL